MTHARPALGRGALNGWFRCLNVLLRGSVNPPAFAGRKHSLSPEEVVAKVSSKAPRPVEGVVKVPSKAPRPVGEGLG